MKMKNVDLIVSLLHLIKNPDWISYSWSEGESQKSFLSILLYFFTDIINEDFNSYEICRNTSLFAIKYL